MSNKVFKIKGYEGFFTDEQIISLIRQGKIKPDDYLSSKDLKGWIKVKDSIYQYYIKEDVLNETI